MLKCQAYKTEKGVVLLAAFASPVQHRVGERSDYDPKRQAGEDTHNFVRAPPSKKTEQPSTGRGKQLFKQRAN
jgi:hypothetical protein